jgi:hypothetical protein
MSATLTVAKAAATAWTAFDVGGVTRENATVAVSLWPIWDNSSGRRRRPRTMTVPRRAAAAAVATSSSAHTTTFAVGLVSPSAGRTQVARQPMTSRITKLGPEAAARSSTDVAVTLRRSGSWSNADRAARHPRLSLATTTDSVAGAGVAVVASSPRRTASSRS